MKNEKKSNSYLILSIVIIALVAFAVRGCGVSDDGSGADAVRTELNAAGSNQSGITTGIGTAESAAGELETAVNDAENAAGKIEANEREAGAIIADCQRIIREIRERGEGKTAEP